MNNEENEENENAIVCQDCGEVIENEDEAYRTADGDIICECCLDSNYITCECCGDIIPNDSSIYIHGSDKYVCEDCADSNFHQCADCGDWFDFDCGGISTANGEVVCESCSNNYIYCEGCNEYYPEDEIYYDEESQSYYCDCCFDDLNRSRPAHSGAPTIYGYHDFKDWKLYKCEDEDEPPFYIGFELEVQPKNYNDHQDEALHCVYNNLNAICAHDGSLGYGGFEIISHPQSYKYIMANKQKLTETLDKLIELGYSSHDNTTCGLHFHITRPNDSSIVDRIWLILETYKKEIIMLSRRTSSQISKWAHFLSDTDSIDNNKLKALYFIQKTDKSSERYFALNNRNEKTIEFRFFRGTLKSTTFLASVEFINNLMTLCSNTEIPVEEITWDKLCQGDYICKYVTERNITTDVTPVDKSLEFVKLENKQKSIMIKINKILLKKARGLLNDCSIKTTNIKSLSGIRNVSAQLYRYYSNLTDGFFGDIERLEFNSNNTNTKVYITNLEHILSRYLFEGEDKEKIIELLNELKKSEVIL